MKLKEFLAQFKGIPRDSEIYFQMSDGCCGDQFELDLLDVEDSGLIANKRYVGIKFAALPFLTSCIASGMAQRAVAKHREKK